jgi:hypothetical protein
MDITFGEVNVAPVQRQRLTATQTSTEHEHDERLETVTVRGFEEPPNLYGLQVARLAPPDGRTLHRNCRVASYQSVAYGDVQHRAAHGVNQPPGRI